MLIIFDEFIDLMAVNRSEVAPKRTDIHKHGIFNGNLIIIGFAEFDYSVISLSNLGHLPQNDGQTRPTGTTTLRICSQTRQKKDATSSTFASAGHGDGIHLNRVLHIEPLGTSRC